MTFASCLRVGICAFAVCWSGAYTHADLISNGGFENGLADWQSHGPIGYWEVPDPSGNHVVEIGEGRSSADLYQSFTLDSASALTLSFSLGEYYGAYGDGFGTHLVFASIVDSTNATAWSGPGADAFSPSFPPNYETVTSFAFSIPSLAAGTYALDFYSPIGWTTIDNVSLTTGAVPEPSSFALAGLGVIGLATHAFRRRRVASAR